MAMNQQYSMSQPQNQQLYPNTTTTRDVSYTVPQQIQPNPGYSQFGQAQSGYVQFQQQPLQQMQYIPPSPFVRIVPNINAIMPQEIPMDGKTYLFANSDFTEVYGKRWTADARIETTVFRPVTPEDPAQNADSNSIIREINERLDRIEKSIQRKPYYPKKDRPKEVKNNG